MKSISTALAAGLLAATPLAAEQVFNENIIIDGRLCVGTACAAGEAFSSSTNLKLKSTSLAIDFEDTTGDPDFASGDWRIQVNETSQFGRDAIILKDLETGNAVAVFEGGAPPSAFWLDDTGRVGLGTSLPGQALHLAGSSDPGIRFENGDNYWDIRTNSYFFWVRNSAASNIPFSISRFAPSNAFWMLYDGNIGLGTNNPTAALHVRHSGAKILVEETNDAVTPRTLMALQNYGRPEIVMANTSTGGEWSFGAGTNFILKQGVVGSASSAKTKLFEVKANGDATLTGSLTTGGTTCGGGCDLVFTDRAIIAQADYADTMWTQGHLPHVGPTKEGDPINVSQKLGGMLNALEHAHIFIDEQRAEIARLEARLARLEAEMPIK